ncbi:MAG: hypothetical protein F4201_09780 [Nitrospira sp. SB0677_bin_15]|nr:hypothetical protein [Nitrospira sp. SB0667_bin_9]MYD30689.1 hypothetical protein [Nitrospira sp. SB0661_bin_20]MYG41082.1 hypothetical protein [Nitrospira sp. SB0677_bin_15]MYH01796.1 hypothetical protein [Nitrospira sp. SB0675_bin_23]
MTKPRELFVPARITDVYTYDLGEVRKVTLTLPETFDVDGRPVPIRDRMHPGSAFLVKPFGVRTQKYRRRMYTRSNCSDESPHVLETIINDTHKEKADTSPWWQTDDLVHRCRTGGSVDVCVNYDETRPELVVYQNTQTVDPATLILEEDHEWHSMRIVAVALSTGITPFLAYVRYMKSRVFGGAAEGHFSLIVSVKKPSQLMEHQALLDLSQEFPRRFTYHPVLTREWPDDWAHGKGRIMQVLAEGQETRVNLEPLVALEPNLSQCHVRFCGNALAKDQLVLGLEQAQLTPLSFRSETW